MGLEGAWTRAFVLSWLRPLWRPVPSACGTGPWALLCVGPEGRQTSSCLCEELDGRSGPEAGVIS